MKNQLIRKALDILFFCSIIIIIFCISSYIFYNQVYNDNTTLKYDSDLLPHIYYTEIHFKEGYPISYPLFHYTIYIVSNIFLISLNTSAIIILSLQKVITFLLIYNFFNYFLENKISKKICMLLAIIQFFISAIYVTFFNVNIYLGQGSPNLWHNPTSIMSIPFAFLSTFLIIKILKNKGKKQNFYLFFLFISLILSILAKPNFMIAFLPASCCFILYYHPKKWKLYLKFSLILIPVIILVTMQFFSILHNGTTALNERKIIFDFFGVSSNYSKDPLFSLILLIAFPFSILLFYKQSRKNQYLMFSWITFAFSLIPFYFFAEDGNKYLHVNFGWGRQIVIPVLFTFSIIEFLKIQKIDCKHHDENILKNYPQETSQTDKEIIKEWFIFKLMKNHKEKIKIIVSWILLILHLLSGLLYFYRIFSGMGYY
uniref:Glycosyltransferase RgtA/B/C/D-like domain-containing protein n=1 Tax=Promethearchaeum syntrophicum TaxID=2594042 RepID=A0A5B9DA78_9ARCH|nr:hypothetical protein DSAG12_01841 [Candidatus Prometheoarchaeum syntrophicum]